MPHPNNLVNQIWFARVGLVLLLAGLILITPGCRAKWSSPGSAGPTREVVDEGGRHLVVPQKIDRVISLAPSLTEIVFAIGANDKLVGVTSYCDYPAAAKRIAKVGDTIQPNVEAILALRPQLILVSTASQLEAFVQKMREQNIAVYVTDPRDLEGIFRTITNLGELLSARENADQVVGRLRARTAAVEAKVKDKPPVRVFFQLSREPLYTSGKDAYVTDMIRRAGGISVTADVPGAFPLYSAEAALASRPDAVVMTTGDSMSGPLNARVSESLLRSPAVLNGRVYEINGDLISRPGPRAVDGLEQMAQALHADAF